MRGIAAICFSIALGACTVADPTAQWCPYGPIDAGIRRDLLPCDPHAFVTVHGGHAIACVLCSDTGCTDTSTVTLFRPHVLDGEQACWVPITGP